MSSLLSRAHELLHNPQNSSNSMPLQPSQVRWQTRGSAVPSSSLTTNSGVVSQDLPPLPSDSSLAATEILDPSSLISTTSTTLSTIQN